MMTEAARERAFRDTVCTSLRGWPPEPEWQSPPHFDQVERPAPGNRAVPPSRQIAGGLRGRMEAGEYPPGSALPSILTLARECGVTTNTVHKALGILKDEGLVESVPGYGTFVRRG